jgi:hypothetical protein
MRKIEYLVVHCSATPNGRKDTAADIHRWHQKRGWTGIGYNAVVETDGSLIQGRPDYWQGAHVRDFDENGEGDNSDSLGICLIGTDEFNDAQMRSLEGWLLYKTLQYPDAQVVGHRNLDARKTCPNFDVPAWWASRKKRHID